MKKKYISSQTIVEQLNVKYALLLNESDIKTDPTDVLDAPSRLYC